MYILMCTKCHKKAARRNSMFKAISYCMDCAAAANTLEEGDYDPEPDEFKAFYALVCEASVEQK